MRSIVIILMLLCFNASAQQMRIGILRAVKTQKCVFEPDQGMYLLFADTLIIDTLVSGKKITVTSVGGKVRLEGEKGIFIVAKARFLQETANCSMQITSTNPVSKTRKYRDNFELSPESSGRLRIVNLVMLNNYLEGVIESEGGGGQRIEYYKVQSLMSRTYAIQNIKRHAKDGFELCDEVHCQAYHNMMSHSPIIHDAVTATTGELIVDANNKPLTTYFYANCGGQTCDASYVWNTPVSYCETFIDTFCIHTKQATWVKYIDRSSWESYLSKEYGYPVRDSAYSALMYHFVQPERKAFYIHPMFGIPLRDLRTRFKLKSTFFNVSLEGDRVRIDGRGFGHGVGLCQEGAMEMARQGFTYRQIALFYFNDVQIVNLDRLHFFGQEHSIEE